VLRFDDPVRLALLVVLCVLAAGCEHGSGSTSSHGSTGPWRIGDPADSPRFVPGADSDRLLTRAMMRRFSKFPLYWVGTHFEKWPLVAITAQTRTNPIVAFIYGSCTLSDDDEPSCVPPLQIQVVPLCRELGVATAHPIWRRRLARGAPVATVDHAPVLLSRRVQVKVYAASGSTALRVLRELRSANLMRPIVEAADPMPAAPLSVLTGKRACGP
jgi:hypothetical protein